MLIVCAPVTSIGDYQYWVLLTDVQFSIATDTSSYVYWPTFTPLFYLLSQEVTAYSSG